MRRRENPLGVRFITFSCHRRLPALAIGDVARTLTRALARARAEHGLALYAWVAMPEHVHLLVAPGRRVILGADHWELVPLSDTLRSVKMSVSRRCLPGLAGTDLGPDLRDSDGVPRLWQAGGGFDRNVRSMGEFCREVRYVHRNPVERGRVDRPEDYRWSSVRWWAGVRDGPWGPELECDPPPGWGIDWSGWKGFV
ncbi:MAG: hypothetical protein K2Q20_04625 [Phycisphaerales bacterium]|nr:hypothetical protein [Phycisphaerales bacterium]